MKRDIDLYLSDILESIDVIKGRTKDLSEEDFKKDGEKHESVVYRLATIGEAVNVKTPICWTVILMFGARYGT